MSVEHLARFEFLYSLFKNRIKDQGDLLHPRRGNQYNVPFYYPPELMGCAAFLARRGYGAEFNSYDFDMRLATINLVCLPDRTNAYLFLVAVMRKKIPLVKEFGKILMDFLIVR